MANWIKTLNSKYGVTDKVTKANNFLKDLVEPGSAIVGVLESNGIAGFKFHIPQTEQIKFESEITDHYTSLNSSFQDHIALKPITITVSGLQGEYFYDLHPIENAVSTVVSTLNLVSQFLPSVSNVVKTIKTKKAINDQLKKQGLDKNSFTAQQLKEQYNYEEFNAIDLWALFQNLFKLKSAQTRAFLYFEALWKNKTPFTVETTWKRYDNMVIQSLTPIRDNNADITQFNITFKQIQIAVSKTTDINSTGRLSLQASDVIKKGESKGSSVVATMSYAEDLSQYV